ncbi:uncharacterized protein METZ01_LOCUS316035 [marine metagenome]|uniref:Uncharacterized protein n=1 Tax=marine metagenome TaxID=408172 RepID=A0A382NUE9_9ZZZZ
MVGRNYVDRGGILMPDRIFGICAWRLPSGELIMDADRNILCAEGFVGDPVIERQVAEAAAYWSDNAGGKVHWVEGARKISDDELDDQGGRLLDGKIPDPMEDFFDPTKVMPGDGGNHD